MDTRPIWEQVLQRLEGVDLSFDRVESRFDRVEKSLGAVELRLDGVETRLEGVETKLVAVENRLARVEHEIYALGKKFRVFNQVLDLQNAQEDFEERVTKLEGRPNELGP